MILITKIKLKAVITITRQELENNFKFEDYSLQNLRALGFKKHHSLDSESWSTYKFPVYKHLNTVTLECELKVNLENGSIHLDVYDMDRDPFPAFYMEPTSYNKRLISSIHNKILKEYKKLGVVKCKE